MVHQILTLCGCRKLHNQVYVRRHQLTGPSEHVGLFLHSMMYIYSSILSEVNKRENKRKDQAAPNEGPIQQHLT
jgi:hypothetical protein